MLLLIIAHAQVGIKESNQDPDPSAMLDIQSTDRGLLIPRMDSTSRKAIVNPATGLMVYDSSTQSFWYFGTAWTEIGQGDNLGDHRANANIELNGHWLSQDGDNEGVYVNGTGDVGIGTSAPQGKLTIDNGTDVSPSGGGFLIMGSTSSYNVAIDNNEIMARKSGGTAPLYLQIEGGDLIMGGKVGIGPGLPDSSAILDIESSTQGILVPRMTASQRQLISSPAQGLLVYQTNGLQGFYFYDGSNWLGLNAGDSDAISDADQDTKIQVEESADEDIIRFDIDGSEQFRMHNRVIEPGTKNTFMGLEAGQNTNHFGSPLSGNVGIGYRAFQSNVDGSLSVAIGRESMKQMTDGVGNIGIGYGAMQNTITAQENVGVGGLALRNNQGNNNTAVGQGALRDNGPGSNNTALGYNADVGSDSLTNATAIGANSLVSSDNSLILGDSARVGIGTSSPDQSALLEINSTSQGFLLPRLNQKQILAIANPAEGLVVYNTVRKKPIYFDGAEWKSYDGSNPIYYQVGDYTEGGVVFWVAAGGMNGLICSIHELGNAQWGCVLLDITSGNGASGSTIGTGHLNTDAILVDCPSINNAAAKCVQYVHESYDDWFLPSKDELAAVFQQKAIVSAVSVANGGNALNNGIGAYYWTSTENSLGAAWIQRPVDLYQVASYKTNIESVRAIRNF